MDEAIKLHDEASVLTHLAPLVTGSEAIEGLVLGAATPAPSPVERAEMSETIETVKAALRRLTERQRQVLVLHFLEGMTKGEIADVLGVGRSRITQLMQQGLPQFADRARAGGGGHTRSPCCPIARRKPVEDGAQAPLATRSQSERGAFAGDDLMEPRRQAADLGEWSGAACSGIQRADRVLDTRHDGGLAERAECSRSGPDPDGGVGASATMVTSGQAWARPRDRRRDDHSSARATGNWARSVPRRRGARAGLGNASTPLRSARRLGVGVDGACVRASRPGRPRSGRRDLRLSGQR